MTEPVDPADRFLERMRLVSQEQFGTKYRPGLAKILAESDAPPGDLVRIGALVRAMDTQRRVRLMGWSGAQTSTTGEENDLLDATGAGAEKVKVADYLAKAADVDGRSWWESFGIWAANKFFGEQTTDDIKDGVQVDQALKGFSNLTMGTAEAALNEVSKAPGFLYRAALYNDDVFDKQAIKESAQAQGYDLANSWDEIAFYWNQGESFYGDSLDELRDQYGVEDVNLAVKTFHDGTDLRGYQVSLENEYVKAYESGDEQRMNELAGQIKRVNDPEFLKVYEAVDRKHSSPGRDLARAVLPADMENDTAFTAISGGTDALFTLFADPTLVGGKAVKSVQLARWGIDSIDANKIYHMLGEADQLGRAPTKAYYTSANNARRQGVQAFINTAKDYRAALANGDAAKAAEFYAAASKVHKDLMPLWSEINGVRPALSPMERAWAKANGEKFVDVNGVEAAGGAFRTKPVETVREFADLAANRWGLLRLQNGLASNPKALMPGKMGWNATWRANRAMARTREGLAKQRDTIAAFDFSPRNLDKIIGTDDEELLLKAAEARGQGFHIEEEQWKDLAGKTRAWADRTSRRFSTFLPSSRDLSYHSAAAAQDVRRFARIFLPKSEAEMYAAMWETGNAATRRTLAKALIRESFEAAGFSRSTVGREFMDDYINDLDKLARRKYGFGESDLITDGYQGARRAGLYISQMEEGIHLPSFTKMKQAAAKASVLGYDSGLAQFGWNAKTMQRVARWGGIPAMRYMLFSSTGASRFMQAVKLGWIATGSNMLRNALDEYGGLKLFSNNHGLSVARGRQTMRDAGLGSGGRKVGAFERTAMARKFVGLTNHQIPRGMRQGIRSLRDATLAINKGKLEMMGKQAEWRVEFAKELHDSTVADELGEYLGGRIIDNPDEYLTLGHEFAQEMARSGIPAEAWKFKGYEMLPVDGGAGLKALASMYGQRFVGDSPAHGTLAFIMWHYGRANPSFWKELDADTIARMKKLIFGENDPNPGVTLESMEPTPEYIAELLHRPEFMQLRKEAELFNVDMKGNRIHPDDKDGLELALRRMVPRYIEDVGMSVLGKNGKINAELAQMLLRGKVPTVQELQRIGLDELPGFAVQPQYAFAGGDGINMILNGYTKVMTRFYDGIVTRPIRALVRTPLYVDAYTTARATTQKYADELVEKWGWSRDVADTEAKRLAERHALNEVIKYVDNPKVASQFSAMNKNWWGFFRAQEDWLRRYGRSIKADPTSIRKAQLAVYGAEQAGILDRDENGNLILTYPGSGAIAEAFLNMGAALGGWDMTKIPDVPDMTTRLTFLNPSLNNPFGYSSTPMVSLPYKFLTWATPGGELLESVGDRAINGELGAGRTWYEQLLPVPLVRAAQVMWDDDENTGSFIGGITATAMTNLALSGRLDDVGDTPRDRQHLIADIMQQSRNVAATRAFMALWLPGAPGMPQMGESDEATESDFSYQQAGIMSLKQEYRDMLARMGPGAALALWAEIHPEASVLADATKTETATSARTTATMDAAAFVMENKDFFTGDYADIAPYFMPEDKGAFSQIAWNALLQLEVRQHKDLDDFFIDLTTSRGVSAYYKAQDDYDAQIAERRKHGDKVGVKALQDEWTARKAELHLQYPALDDWMDQGTERRRARMDKIERIAMLAADPEAPARIQPQLAGLTHMLQVWRNFEEANGLLKDQRSTRAQAERQNLKVQFHDAMRSIIEDYPTLEDAYNGIFRPLVQED